MLEVSYYYTEPPDITQTIYRAYELISLNPLSAKKCIFLKLIFNFENTKNNHASTLPGAFQL